MIYKNNKHVVTRITFEVCGPATPPPITTHDTAAHLMDLLNWVQSDNSDCDIDIISVHQDKDYPDYRATQAANMSNNHPTNK